MIDLYKIKSDRFNDIEKYIYNTINNLECYESPTSKYLLFKNYNTFLYEYHIPTKYITYNVNVLDCMCDGYTKDDLEHTIINFFKIYLNIDAVRIETDEMDIFKLWNTKAQQFKKIWIHKF